jgi:hypothetical protein
MKRYVRNTLLLVCAGLSGPAAATCVPERLPAGSGAIGTWIDGGNWLAAGGLRVSLRAPETFLARQRVVSERPALPLPAAAQPLDLDRLTLADPADGAQRSLAFVLDTRLYAESVLVLYNGRVFAERNWHEARSDAPALLPQTGRPLLSLLGAIAVGQGKLAAERAVSRYIPALGNDAGLRRLSVQRLLEGEARFEWSAADLDGWRRAAGWPGAAAAGNAAPAPGGVREWLRQPERWDAGLLDLPSPTAVGGPEDDLLAWLLAESQSAPLARLTCEQLFDRLRPEGPITWMADTAGNELGGGLAMSLRDFARVGQLLIDARAAAGRGRIPAWFIEALAAPVARGGGNVPAGLRRGGEMRYGFVRLAGPGSRVAIVGAHGTSLYIDFERRMVVALRAAHPEARSPLQLALLESVWERFSAALPMPGRR